MTQKRRAYGKDEIAHNVKEPFFVRFMCSPLKTLETDEIEHVMIF